MAAEKRLIDLLAVNIDEVETSDCTDTEDILSAVITYLCEQPTVDAVEVVRCKDCRHYFWDEFDGCYICLHICKYVKPNFGCVDGERKDNERKAD